MTASTGQASWQNPQYMHLVMSMSYLYPQALSRTADTHVATVHVIVPIPSQGHESNPAGQ